MPTKKDDTASFVIRFTQKIYQSDEGEPQVQWRGNIRHVQGGEEKRFADFQKAMNFIQGKLKDLTVSATEDKTPEEQKGILEKSFSLWKKVAKDAPKMVLETIKDPKKGVAQIQQQLTEVKQDIEHQIEERLEEGKHQIEERIGRKLEIDEWRGPTKADHKEMMEMMAKMSKELARLNKKVNALSK